MNILEKHFPNLLALANSTETNPMQILRTCANAIVEASEIATHLQSIRDEITALKDQVASADKAWTDALASRDRAIDDQEKMAGRIIELTGSLNQARFDLETVNGQRLIAEQIGNDHLAECGRLMEKLRTTSERALEFEAALSLAKADLELAKTLMAEESARCVRLELDRTSKDGVILKLIEERDAAQIRTEQVEQANASQVKELRDLYAEYEKLEHKLRAVKEILTA